jgi:hypothetical protein
MNLAQFLRSQIGSAAKRKRSLSMLLMTSDLPGSGWRTLRQLARRVGFENTMGDISRRCRESGEFWALRSFQHDPERGLFVQVIPYPSPSDATEAGVISGTSSGAQNRNVVVLAEQTITDLEVPGVDDVLVWEHHTQPRGKSTGYQRFIKGRVDNVQFVVSGGASGAGWAWEELVALATAQALRIRAVLTDSGTDLLDGC